MAGTGPSSFEAVRISDRVWWVGAIDWKLRDFHGYLTGRGSTYNAFLIQGDPPILIDTVKKPFYEEMMARIATVVDPRSIGCVVSNHAELDHAGSLPRLLTEIEPALVLTSSLGEKALQQHFHWERKLRTVKEGERIEVGGAALRFIEARMLHWPESMFTYLEGDGVLFSNDAFGMHLAGMERFTDQVDPSIVRYESARYYANILLPFSPLVTKLIERWPGLGLDLRLIAPDHGPAWRRDPAQVIRWYGEWAAQPCARKAVVLYHTMWQSTETMARVVGEGLRAGGVQAVLMPLVACHRSDVVTEVLEAGALLVGSSTMNGQMLPPVADVLTYLKGLRPRNLIGGAFGSYGWGGEAVKLIEQELTAMQIDIVAPGVRVQYVPDTAALGQCRDLGAKVAARLGELAQR